MNERPYAARARELCTEDHSKVWFCPTCRILESRLTPIHEQLRDALAELPSILLTFHREPACDCPMDPHHRWNCALTPIWAQMIRDLDVNPWTVRYLPYVSRNFQAQWRNT